MSQLTLADVPVVDAHVDWHLSSYSPRRLVLHLDGELDHDALLPLSSDNYDDRYLEKHDGLVAIFQIGMGFENRDHVEVETEAGNTISGSWQTPESTHRLLNNDDLVIVRLHDDPSHTALVESSIAKQAISRFINGDEGSPETSYTVWRRDDADWEDVFEERSKYDEYSHAHVGLESDDGNWVIHRIDD